MRRLWCRFVGHEYGARRRYLGRLKPGEIVYCNDPRVVILETCRSIDPIVNMYTMVYEAKCDRCDP